MQRPIGPGVPGGSRFAIRRARPPVGIADASPSRADRRQLCVSPINLARSGRLPACAALHHSCGTRADSDLQRPTCAERRHWLRRAAAATRPGWRWRRTMRSSRVRWRCLCTGSRLPSRCGGSAVPGAPSVPYSPSSRGSTHRLYCILSPSQPIALRGMGARVGAHRASTNVRLDRAQGSEECHKLLRILATNTTDERFKVSVATVLRLLSNLSDAPNDPR